MFPAARCGFSSPSAIAALGVLVGSAAGSGPAHAQNTLEESDPADGAVLSSSPSQIVLTFTEAIGDANQVADRLRERRRQQPVHRTSASPPSATTPAR